MKRKQLILLSFWSIKGYFGTAAIDSPEFAADNPKTRAFNLALTLQVIF